MHTRRNRQYIVIILTIVIIYVFYTKYHTIPPYRYLQLDLIDKSQLLSLNDRILSYSISPSDVLNIITYNKNKSNEIYICSVIEKNNKLCVLTNRTIRFSNISLEFINTNAIPCCSEWASLSPSGSYLSVYYDFKNMRNLSILNLEQGTGIIMPCTNRVHYHLWRHNNRSIMEIATYNDRTASVVERYPFDNTVHVYTLNMTKKSVPIGLTKADEIVFMKNISQDTRKVDIETISLLESNRNQVIKTYPLYKNEMECGILGKSHNILLIFTIQMDVWTRIKRYCGYRIDDRSKIHGGDVKYGISMIDWNNEKIYRIVYGSTNSNIDNIVLKSRYVIESSKKNIYILSGRELHLARLHN